MSRVGRAAGASREDITSCRESAIEPFTLRVKGSIGSPRLGTSGVPLTTRFMAPPDERGTSARGRVRRLRAELVIDGRALRALLVAVLLVGAGATLSLQRARGAAVAQGGDLNVAAAASLTDAFGELGATFESQNPGSRVVFNFGPSSGLRTQLEQGAPADVFASADQAQMDQARAQSHRLPARALAPGGPLHARAPRVIACRPTYRGQHARRSSAPAGNCTAPGPPGRRPRAPGPRTAGPARAGGRPAPGRWGRRLPR